MKKPSDPEIFKSSLRDKIIGLGERSIRKSYYPQLQRQLNEAEESRRQLEEKSTALQNMLEDLEHARTGMADSQARYRSLVENLDDVIFRLDIQGTITYVSPVVKKFVGRMPKEITGLTLQEFVHPDDLPNLQAGFERVLAGQPETQEFRLLDKAGDCRYVRTSSRRLLEGSSVVGLTGVIRDITQIKRDEDALQRLNRELRAISNCNVALMRAEDELALLSNICRIVCDDAGYCMAWVGCPENDDAKTIRPVAWAGFEDDYLAQAQITWADTERGRDPVGGAMRSGKSVSIQDFTTTPNATPWREAALQRGYRSSISLPLKDETANVFGVFNIYSTEPNAFTQDEIRLLEELAEDMAFGIKVLRTRIERQQGEEALRSSQQRMDNIVANSPGAIYRCTNDAEWTMEFLSAAITRITGYSAEDFLGNRIRSYASIIHPDDRRIVREAVSVALERKTQYQMDYRLLVKDGTTRWVHEQGQGLFDPDGRLNILDGFIFDITEQRKAEQEIKRLNQELEQRVSDRTRQLEEANKELETFAYSVSHDLRAPLRAIDGFSRILLDDYAQMIDEEGKRLLNIVRDNTIRMGQLIDAILKFSRTGRLEISLSEIDIEKMVRSVCAEFQTTDNESKLQWKIEPMPLARGDSAMLRQVFVNLLSNAIKFSQTRETPKIEVGARVKDGETIYFVKDNGVGFDMRYVDKLFGVFQRLHSMNEFEGTGIGLATVKRIVTRHGGRVWAEGEVNKGATFFFTLPSMYKSVG